MKHTLIIAIACVLAAAPVLADPKDDAKLHMQAAATAYKEGRFEDTLVELNKAYALDPKPELHYSMGQVYIKLARCDDAIVSYESFLATKPTRDRADLANQAIETCRAQKATTPVPPTTDPNSGIDTEAPPGVPAPIETVPVLDPPRASVDAPAWYKDKLGLALTGGGAVLTIVGLVMYASARGKIDDAENADSYGASQSLYDDAKSQRTTSMVVTVVGLAATGVGVWLLLQKRNEQQAGVAFFPTTSGGMITYSGTYSSGF